MLLNKARRVYLDNERGNKSINHLSRNIELCKFPKLILTDVMCFIKLQILRWIAHDSTGREITVEAVGRGSKKSTIRKVKSKK